MMRVFLYMLVIVIVGCKSINMNSLNTQTKELPIQIISSGFLYGNGIEGISKSNSIVKNRKDWELLVNKMNLGNTSSLKLKKSSIDFSNEMVVCVFDTIRNTGGFKIEIDKIYIENDRTRIDYTIVRPAFKDKVTMVITQPYQIVKTTKREGEIIFTNTEN